MIFRVNLKINMIIEYSIEPISEVAFENTSGILEHMKIDETDIYFDIDDNHILKKLRVCIPGLPMKWERADLINPSYPETRDKAFRVMKYLVDRIQIQAKVKCFDLTSFKNINTVVIPETEEEIENWSKFRKRLRASLEMPYSLLGAVDTSEYESGFRHAQAFSNFTDALNTDNPIVKFERFYKVIETFFTSHGHGLDSDVSGFMQTFNSEFTPNDFRRLRDLRNRCIHPQHRSGHIASNDLSLITDLKYHTKELQKIAELLLR